MKKFLALSAAVVGILSNTSVAHAAEPQPGKQARLSQAAVTLKQEMRKLWTDHVV